MIISYKNHYPKIHPSVFVAPTASVIGRVEIGRGSSVWFGAVLRGDLNRIRVGCRTNIQDNCVLHVERDLECVLGDGVIMGHQATAHACRIEEGALIGIGARVLNGARVGRFALVASGAVVLENTRIPAYSLAVGIPARVVRKLTPREIAHHRRAALRYRKLAASYAAEAPAVNFANGAGVLPVDLSKIF